MSFGFRSHPNFRPVFAVDRQCGKPCSGVGTLECNKSYEANIGIKPLERDLATLTPEDLMAEAGIRPEDLDVLISCAPCTGFSRTLRKNHLHDDPRNSLVGRTGLFVEAIRPRILVMENARELVRGNFSHHCENLRSHLTKLGYSFTAEVHMLSKFGLPQIRERALVIAVRDGQAVRTLDELWEGFSVKPEAITVRNAISHLPSLKAGECYDADPMHVSPKLGVEGMERLRAIPQDGGSWVDLVNRPDADRLLIPSMKRSAERGDFGSHPDVYGRLAWGRPAVTIKRECAHVGNGRYSHPEQDRMLTIREMSILNGFPASYRFVSDSMSNAYRHIGDAVPPMISFQLAHVCDWILTGNRPPISECILPGTSLKPEHVEERLIAESLFAKTG